MQIQVPVLKKLISGKQTSKKKFTHCANVVHFMEKKETQTRVSDTCNLVLRYLLHSTALPNFTYILQEYN